MTIRPILIIDTIVFRITRDSNSFVAPTGLDALLAVLLGLLDNRA